MLPLVADTVTKDPVKNPAPVTERPHRKLPNIPGITPPTTLLERHKKDDSYNEADKHSPSLQTKSHLELSSPEEKTLFLQNWDKLQSTKQLQGIENCKIETGGILLKGEDAFLFLVCQALTAYFQNISELQVLESFLSKKFPTEKPIDVEKNIQSIESNLKDLEDIIHLEGIQKYWNHKDKKELIALFQNTVACFWKNATTQKKDFNCFLTKISPDNIDAIGELKQKVTTIFNHIASCLPYQCSKNVHFIIGNFSVLNKDLPFDLGKNLRPGAISLLHKQDRIRIHEYESILRDALKKSGKHAAKIGIDGKDYNVDETLTFLAERYVRSYLDMSNRYQYLLEYLKRETEQDEINRALKIPKIKTDLFDSLSPYRAEMSELKTNLLALEMLTFDDEIQRRWLPLDLNGQDPSQIRESIRFLLDQKIPSSFAEKAQTRDKIKNISRQWQINPSSINQSTQNQSHAYWKFLEDSCDSKNLNSIFPPEPLMRMDWALNTLHTTLPPLSTQENFWLRNAMPTALEIVKKEWAYWKRIQHFAKLTSDPELQKKITHEEDKVFLESVSKNLRTLLQNSERLSIAMTEALNIELSEEDRFCVNFSRDLEQKLKSLSPENCQNALLKLCNLHTTTLFETTIQDAKLILDDCFRENWNAFIIKYSKPIEKWKTAHKVPEENDHNLDIGYHNLLYIPFQQRIGGYPLLWQILKKETPAIFYNAIELTYLRVKLKTDEVSRNMLY